MNLIPIDNRLPAESRRLHIGGKLKREGWEVFNALPGSHVDHLGNANDLSRFTDATFEAIYASHAVEHFDHRNELLNTLSEWCRVLKPGGELMISVPDLETLSKMILNKKLTQQDRYFVMLIIFGGHVDKYDYHGVGLTEEFLRDFLLRAGFSDIQRVESLGLFQDSSEQKHVGQRISLNMKASKPPKQSISQEAVNSEFAHGCALLNENRYQEALDSFDRVLKLNQNHVGALANKGFVLGRLNRLKEALECYEHALGISPDFVTARTNYGNALRDLGRLEEALKSYDWALELKPDYIVAIYNRGISLLFLKRFEEAVACFDKMLVLKSDYAAVALNKRGVALFELNRHDESLESYDRALIIKPDYPEALRNRSEVLAILNRSKDALDSCNQALAIEQAYPVNFANNLQYKAKICDWNGIAEMYHELGRRIHAGQVVLGPLLESPLGLLYRLRAAKNYIQERFPARTVLPPLAARSHRSKIRLGYFSTDFREHPVAYLLAELIEKHDRSKFETIAFSLTPSHKSAIKSRLESAFDQFINVKEQSDIELVLLARQLEIDIVIDLNGLIGVGYGGRPGVFALRAAPVQVGYLGYPGTMGADYIDYLIADHTLIPEQHRQFYTEKIAYLPDCYMCNDTHKEISGRRFSRSELGLPEVGFVFACCHSNKKISPDVFDIWMRLLAKVNGSVLWIFLLNEEAAANLKNEAVKRGVDSGRLVIATRTESLADHLARLCLADLFLDTLHWNAHSTASEVLWAGLPVLTLLGETFAGRVGASLLRAIGLPELVTYTVAEYEAMALTLAMDKDKLAKLKVHLAENRFTCPLFDIGLYTRHIEAAYRAMWERYQSGHNPEHIVVKSFAGP